MVDADAFFDEIRKEGLKKQGRDPDRIDFSKEPKIEFLGEGHDLHPGQKEAWASEATHTAVIAGSQSGKTVIGPYWVLREIQRCGGQDHLIVGPNFPIMDRKLVPECIAVWRDKYGLGDYKVGRRTFEFSPEGLRKLGVPRAAVYFGFAEDPETLESMTAFSCWRDETGQSKFSRAAAEAIDRRLTVAKKLGFGRILDTTTPYEAGGWFQEEVWDRRLENDGYLKVVSYKSTDNPVFSKEEAQRQKEKLPDWRYRMMYEGQFTRPAGAVYDNFDKEKHVVESFIPPPHWRRYYGIDFGQVHTFVVCAAEHPEEKDSEGFPVLYVYHEHFPNRATATWQHVKALNTAEAQFVTEYRRENPEYRGSLQRPRCIGGAKNEGDWRLEWGAAGMPVEEPYVKDLQTGIDRTYATIGRGGLKFMSHCTRTIAYIEGYSWEIDDNGEPIPGKIVKKDEQHGADAPRYLCVQLRPNGKTQGELKRTMYFGAATPQTDSPDDDWAA